MRPKAAAVAPLRFIEFQQPTLVEKPPEGDAWIHEIKYDGYQTELIIHAGKAKAFTRRAFDWTDKYPGIVKAAADLPVKSAIIDGEVVVFDKKGRADISKLKSSMALAPDRLVF